MHINNCVHEWPDVSSKIQFFVLSHILHTGALLLRLLYPLPCLLALQTAQNNLRVALAKVKVKSVVAGHNACPQDAQILSLMFGRTCDISSSHVCPWICDFSEVVLHVFGQLVEVLKKKQTLSDEVSAGFEPKSQKQKSKPTSRPQLFLSQCFNFPEFTSQRQPPSKYIRPQNPRLDTSL